MRARARVRGLQSRLLLLKPSSIYIECTFCRERARLAPIDRNHRVVHAQHCVWVLWGGGGLPPQDFMPKPLVSEFTFKEAFTSPTSKGACHSHAAIISRSRKDALDPSRPVSELGPAVRRFHLLLVVVERRTSSLHVRH